MLPRYTIQTADAGYKTKASQWMLERFSKMSEKTHQSNLPDYRIAALMLILSAIIGGAYLLLPINTTLTIVMLLGIWAGDAFLKHRFDLGLDTALADLSFATFIFACSRGLDAIANVSGIAAKDSQLLSTFVIGFILGILWIVNLSTCQSLDYPKSLAHQRWGILFSVVVTCGSLTTAVVAQYKGAI